MASNTLLKADDRGNLHRPKHGQTQREFYYDYMEPGLAIWMLVPYPGTTLKDYHDRRLNTVESGCSVVHKYRIWIFWYGPVESNEILRKPINFLDVEVSMLWRAFMCITLIMLSIVCRVVAIVQQLHLYQGSYTYPHWWINLIWGNEKVQLRGAWPVKSKRNLTSGDSWWMSNSCRQSCKVHVQSVDLTSQEHAQFLATCMAMLCQMWYFQRAPMLNYNPGNPDHPPVLTTFCNLSCRLSSPHPPAPRLIVHDTLTANLIQRIDHVQHLVVLHHGSARLELQLATSTACELRACTMCVRKMPISMTYHYISLLYITIIFTNNKWGIDKVSTIKLYTVTYCYYDRPVCSYNGRHHGSAVKRSFRRIFSMAGAISAARLPSPVTK